MNEERHIVCPLCNDRVDKLLYRFHIDSERAVIERIKTDHPEWTVNDGLCGRCVDYYHTQVVIMHRMLPEVGPYFPVKSPDDFVILPTPIRLDADPRFTGKGVTICIIDSGFYPHPDLVGTTNRIKKMIDVTANDVGANTGASFFTAGWERGAWHGTMTAVVAAGDGYSSGGLYRSIAPDAELVLIKVQNDAGRITTSNVVRALEWVVEHGEEYGIRIVNMSISGDEAASQHDSPLDRAAAKLVERGVVIVAAAGNNENSALLSPADSPHVITVGGIDDGNTLDEDKLSLYHSTYGEVEGGLRKPELVAQAIWIAAPILPGTEQKVEAEWLHDVFKMNDDELTENLYLIAQKINCDISTLAENRVPFIRQLVKERIQQTKFFSRDYMHVDGTSFATPIVCSVIAQLLDADTALTPRQIRHALFSTATRIPHLPIERQGLGYVRPRKAIFNILKKGVCMKVHDSPFINKRKKTIEFYIQNECAHHISLAGSFNHWAHDLLLLEPHRDGVWKITIPMLPEGRYYYKFFIDDRMWVEDVDNPHRVPDGLNGWNSVLILDN